ncbi:MAG: peptidyl-tRNA hydrolase Pth2 [Candidatus Anstonellaceae archaeon]
MEKTNKELKQTLIIRTDLKMGKGKIASQIAHASVLGYYYVMQQNPKLAKTWFETGMKKIVLKIESLEKLLEIYKEAKNKKIPAFLVKDAGKTQVESMTITSLCLGPDYEDKIDLIAGRLKLL